MILIPGRSTPVWPVHPQPLPDELLSSWMTRLARANQMKVHSFYALHFGRGAQIWNRDIDKSAPNWLLDGLSSWTGYDRLDIDKLALHSYEGLLYEHHNAYGNSKWILPMGVYHRTRRLRGLVYCPLCLAEDSEPYFRKSWRLSFNTVCEHHGTEMRDACPKCDEPVVFYRRELGHRNTGVVDSMVLCHSCGFDLRCAPIAEARSPDAATLACLRSLIAQRENGWVRCDNLDFNYSILFFDVWHYLATYLTSRYGRKLMVVAERDIPEPMCNGAAFKRCLLDMRNLGDRHALLMTALWLLQDWPERFIRVRCGAKLCESHVTRSEHLSYWFHSVLRFMPSARNNG